MNRRFKSIRSTNKDKRVRLPRTLEELKKWGTEEGKDDGRNDINLKEYI